MIRKEGQIGGLYRKHGAQTTKKIIQIQKPQSKFAAFYLCVNFGLEDFI